MGHSMPTDLKTVWFITYRVSNVLFFTFEAQFPSSDAFKLKEFGIQAPCWSKFNVITFILFSFVKISMSRKVNSAQWQDHVFYHSTFFQPADCHAGPMGAALSSSCGTPSAQGKKRHCSVADDCTPQCIWDRHGIQHLMHYKTFLARIFFGFAIEFESLGHYSIHLAL